MRKRVPHLLRYGYQDVFHHAESHVLTKLRCKPPKDSCLIVIRAQKTKLGMSKPCPHCTGLILSCGIRDVWYSTTDGSMKYMRLA